MARCTGGEREESDLSGNALEEYIFFNGRRVARRDVSTNAVHYYFSDHLGTHAVVENATGTACEQDIDCYPYGGVQHDYCGTVAQNYKFNGKERDAESGLDNFGARYDASNLGRFMTPDWAEKATAVPYANFGNPQSLNLYSYVENNPTTMGDPDGHQNGTTQGDAAITSNCNAVGPSNCNEPAKANDDAAKKANQAQNPPPPPKPPGLTGQAKKEFLRAMDHRKVGNMKLSKAEKIMSSEDKSLSGGQPGQLPNGKIALANAIMNSASLPQPNKMAKITGGATEEDQQIMREQFFNRATGGDDPVEGRTYYGTSQEDLSSRPAGNHLPGAAGRETVYDSFGPFNDSYSGQPTFIYIYNDPGH